jgi:hypothetical protein
MSSTSLFLKSRKERKVTKKMGWFMSMLNRTRRIWSLIQVFFFLFKC